MQDNYSDENIIQYIDDEMTMDEKQAFEKLLQQDMVLYERYQFMLAAKQAIRSKGLKEQVSKIHEEYIRSLHRPGSYNSPGFPQAFNFQNFYAGSGSADLCCCGLWRFRIQYNRQRFFI
jgi:hypothetical protein